MPTKASPKKNTRRGFGSIKRERNGRFSASYADPEGRSYIDRNGNPKVVRHNAPSTFQTRVDAEGWLTDERRRISAGTWTSPAQRRAAKLAEEASRLPTFANYATQWVAGRKNKTGKPLAARTRDHYNQLLDDYLIPAFGYLALDDITPGHVNLWYDGFRPKTQRKQGVMVTGDTTRAHAYGLGRAIMNTAVSAHGPMVGQVNPFAVRGGGSGSTPRRDIVATSQQVDTMLNTIRPEWRLIVLLGLWCGLRFSEIAELRIGDIDVKAKVIRVRRSVSRSKVEGVRPKDPKSEAGIRDQAIPSHVLPDLVRYLAADMRGKDALLFPGRGGGHLAPATFYGKAPKTPSQSTASNGWYAARAAAGCPSLHFHDLRATGATLLAQSGYSVADIQRFLGDSTPAAAMRYVRSADGRQALMAETMSALAKGGTW